MNLTTKTVQGIGWSGTSEFIRLLLRFVITVILARLLTPNDFGLLAMVIVFTNFAGIFRDFGLTAALIQREGLTEEHLSSSFWINVLVGLFLTLLMAALAPAIAFFYGENKLTLIVILLATTFFVRSFGAVQTALFTRELNFRSLAIIEILTVAISGTAGIILAFAGLGIWSLVWQQVIFSFTMVTLLWTFSGWRPKFLFHWQSVKHLLGFGLNLTGFNFVNFFGRNLDNLLIGKLLGSTSLGFYNLAYRLLLFPLNNISAVIGRVMFPSLSAIQKNKGKVRNNYIKATRYISAVTFPIMMGLLVVAPEFVRGIFGPQWERSIFLVQILAVVGLAQSVLTTVGWIYTSQGRTDIQLRWGIFAISIVTVSFLVGLLWDLEGVAIAYAIAQSLLLYPALAIPFRLINLKVSYFARQFTSIFLATIGMVIITGILRTSLKTASETSDLAVLILAVLVGIISYAVILFILDKSLYQEAFHLIKQLRISSSADAAYHENSNSEK